MDNLHTLDTRDTRKVVTIRILGREYQVGCSPEEEIPLQKAVQYVDHHMRAIRNSGRPVVGMERMAMMVALNLAHELMVAQEEKARYMHEMTTRIRALQAQLDAYSIVPCEAAQV